MALTPEESQKLNDTLEACTTVAATTEEILTEIQNGNAQAADIAAGIATHNNNADAHSAVKSDAVNSTSSQTVATSKAVKTAYDLANTANTTAANGVAAANLIIRNSETGDEVAAAHNCIYRGKNLTNVYTLAQLSAKLAAGDFSDLYIGDYFTYPFTYGGTTKNINFRIAHLNYWKYMGNVDSSNGLSVLGAKPNTFNQTTANHIVFIPDTALFNSEFNPTNDTTGAVRWSYLWQLLNRTDNKQKFTDKNGTDTDTTDACVYTALNAANCMNGHIIGYSDWLPTAINDTADSMAGSAFVGTSSASIWCDEYLGLCTEPMVYGGTVWSSSARDVGCKKSQLALFRLDPTWITGRSSRYPWWLGAVASSTHFAFAGGGSRAGYASASVVYGVRPLFLFS